MQTSWIPLDQCTKNYKKPNKFFQRSFSEAGKLITSTCKHLPISCEYPRAPALRFRRIKVVSIQSKLVCVRGSSVLVCFAVKKVSKKIWGLSRIFQWWTRSLIWSWRQELVFLVRNTQPLRTFIDVELQRRHISRLNELTLSRRSKTEMFINESLLYRWKQHMTKYRWIPASFVDSLESSQTVTLTTSAFWLTRPFLFIGT